MNTLAERTWRTSLVLGLAIAGAFLLYQGTQLGAYGASWDEPLHFSWGKIVLAYLMTHDEKLLTLLAGNGLYYGPLFFMATVGLSSLLFHSFHLPFIAATHVLMVLTSAVGVFLTFLIAERMFTRRVAVFASLALILFPSFLAHSHYNPKDIPLMTAALLVIFTVQRALRRWNARSFALAGATFGLAFAIKISALILLPILACGYVVRLFELRSLQVRATAMFGMAFILLALITVFAAWPLLWFHPSILSRAVSLFLSAEFWQGRVLYLGAEYAGSELPWHYTIVELAIATPLLTLILAIVGCSITVFGLTRRLKADHVLLLAWFALPLVLSLKPGLPRYDGMRQFFFLVPALAILAGRGLDAILTWLKRGALLTIGLPVAIVVWLLIDIWRVHPYEGSYVNEVVRFIVPEHIERTFELEYWAPTYKEGMAWLNAHAEPNATVCVPIAGNVILWYAPWRSDIAFDCEKDFQYLMFITRFALLEDRYEQQAGETVFAVQRHNSDLMKIIKNEK